MYFGARTLTGKAGLTGMEEAKGSVGRRAIEGAGGKDGGL
jgi:hypothetical protein